jgi:hypothetical protein
MQFGTEEVREREAPAPGECFCHLIRCHPHSSYDELCDVCREEFDREYATWLDEIERAAPREDEHEPEAQIELGPLEVVELETLIRKTAAPETPAERNAA